jgi:hypothetical protein
MESFEDFRSGVFRFVDNKPKAWRDGQAVFNYINDTYGVARAVQFGKNVDCFFDDTKIDEFIRESYDVYLDGCIENEIKDSNIDVERWVLEKVENTLRLCANHFNSQEKKTSLDRDIIADLNRIRKLLNGQELSGMERNEPLVYFKK